MFKYDWFSPIKDVMEKYVPHGEINILEVGSFEGLSTLWFLQRGAFVTSIDHFYGGSDQRELDTKDLFTRFSENISEYSDKLILYKNNSWNILHKLETESYDLVFVDGSHESWDVLHDLIEAYRVLRKDGILIADDYSWEPTRESRPQVAIDCMLKCFSGKLQLLEISRVAVMRKL